MQDKNRILWLPLIQGIYFLITAIWPLIDIESFMLVTGPKTDVWLVRTVSVLLIPYTLICFWIALKPRLISKIIIIIMTLMSLGLAIIELIYYLNGTIKWLYGADAVLQLIFMIWWIFQIKKLDKHSF